MLGSTERLLDAGYGDRVFDERDLARVYGGPPNRRYGLVNKALAKGELVRLRRGFYCLSERYRTAPISSYHVASRLVPWSVVSMESALSLHGWIPERVAGVSSVCTGRRSTAYDTPFGQLRYTHVPVRPHAWMRSVGRQERNGQPFLVADPLRALADHVYASRMAWSGMDYLLEGLRIYPDGLEDLTVEDFEVVRSIYRSRRVCAFLTLLARELDL